MEQQSEMHMEQGEDNSLRSFLTASNIKRLFSFLKPYAWQMSIAILATLVAGGIYAYFPLKVAELLEAITKEGNYRILNLFALGLVVIFTFHAAFTYLESYLMAYVGQKVVLDLRKMLYRHLQGLSFDFFSKQRVGDLVSRLSNDVTQLHSVLTTNIAMFLSGMSMLLFSLFFMFKMNSRFTFFILAIAPILILLTFYFSGRIERGSTKVTDQLAKATVIAEEGLQGIRVVKSFGREDHEVNRYGTAMDKTFKSSLRIAYYDNLFTAAMDFLGLCAIVAVVWFGGKEVIAGRLSLAMITSFLVYGVSIANALAGIAHTYSQFTAAIGGIRRVFEILDMHPTVKNSPQALSMKACKGDITFQDVTFCYDGKTPVIQDLSLHIKAGEVLALVGPSGAGKSTLFNLIPRFYDPTQGKVALDGHDLQDLTQESLRDQIAVVPQETMLFGGTIRENLLYGKLDATEEEMVQAAKGANAHDFIMELPDRYDSIVGERGVNLSGGQRQRIAIARAILRDPKILLLDEATSALDNESEELVQDALNHLMQNDRTTIIIAHRLSTIKVANRIAVLDAGRLVELGTHEELMTLNGLYAKLYNMQFRNPEELLANA